MAFAKFVWFFFIKSLNRIQRNLTLSKISTSSIKFVIFGPIKKKKTKQTKRRWPLRPLIGWNFQLISEPAESRQLYRKKDLNVIYQVCVFRANPKNKMAALASDWLRHFRLLLWNSRIKFDETLQEARYQYPLPNFSFFEPIKKSRWTPWSLIGWDIFDFSSAETT